MSVRINSITIKVQARAFHASFELWQLQGNSLNPKWQRSDLRYTRVTDPKRGEVRCSHFYLLPHRALKGEFPKNQMFPSTCNIICLVCLVRVAEFWRYRLSSLRCDGTRWHFACADRCSTFAISLSRNHGLVTQHNPQAANSFM